MKKIIAVLILISSFLFTVPYNSTAHTTVELDFYDIFEQQGSILLIFDSKTGAIEHANKAAAEFYGYSTAQLESMKIYDINTLAPEEMEKEIQDAVNEKRNYFISKHRLANGDIRTVEVYSCPHTQGDKTILFSTVYDITDRIRLEEKNKVMTNAFMLLLSAISVLLLLIILSLFKKERQLKLKNHEMSNFIELRNTFIDANDTLTYLKDENFKYIFINKAVENFYNKESSAIIGYDDFAVTDKEFAELNRKTDIDALQNKTIVVDEVEWQNRILEMKKFPVKLVNGHYGVGTYIKDITSRKQAQNNIIRANEQLERANKQLQEKQYALEEQNTIIEELNSQLEDENERYLRQEEILQAIVDSLGAGVMMMDSSNRIIFINKAWKKLFDYLELGESSQMYEGFYIGGDASGNTEEFIQKMMAGMENSGEITKKLLRLIGDTESRFVVDLEQTSPVKRFLRLYSNPCVSQKKNDFGRVFVISDISHQKEVDRLKLELISTVSHELRTPMSSILGFSELMLTRKLTEERNREYIGIINSEARRLTELINDFLDIQRMESGKQVFNKQWNSLEPIIEDAIKLYENAGHKHHIIFEKSTESISEVYCDRNKIMQVLSNLLSNAVKYSPDGGEIRVALAVEDGRAKVSVTDHGLGIPEGVKDKIFTKFFRVDNDDHRKIGGTGLGLAICKEIINAHGGEIGFESVYGKGSTFYFYLPCSQDNRTDEEAIEKGTFNPVSGTKNRLLIVEDDASMVKLIKEILKEENLEIDDVSSGEEALEMILRNRYKLIMLDIALSGQMNGWDVLKRLKDNQATVDTPIIISSIYENKCIAAQSGITDYLVKPFEPEQLIRVIKNAINGKLNSKMMVCSDDSLTESILQMLSSRGISVRKIEYSGNLLVITIDGKEGLDNA